MNDEKPRLGAGDVKIMLDDGEGTMEELILRPSYNAAKILSSQGGGIMRMMQRVVDGDLDAVVSIITLGLGYVTQTRRGPKDLPERVWRTGLSDEAGGLSERCITYLRVLMAGGRMPQANSEEGAEEGSTDPRGAR
jgi:hypothetical protein